MESKTIAKTINFFILLAVIGTPIFYFKRGVYPYTLSKTAFFQSIVEIIFLLWLVLIIYDKRYLPKRTPLLTALAVFLAVLVIASIFGADPWRSFWSSQERAVGVIVFFHLVALALIISSISKEINKTKFLYASIGTASFVSLLAFLQLQYPNLLLNEAVSNRPGATFGNPTFFAGYLIFNIFIGAYYILKLFEVDEKGVRPQLGIIKVSFLSITIVINTAALFLTKTRGDLIGLAIGIATIVFMFALRPPRFAAKVLKENYFYGIVLACMIGLGLIFWFTRSASLWKNIPGTSRFLEISLDSKELQPRLAAINAAWLGFLEKPILGWGWENFNIVFNKHYDPKTLELSYQETRFDKPHNAPLEYLVTGGAPLFIAYLGIFGAFLYESLKLKDRLFGQMLFAGAVAYFVRNIFVFDTIGPLLLFYVLIGFADGEYRIEKELRQSALSAKTPRDGFKKIPIGVITFLCLIAFVIAYFINVTTLKASYRQFWGFQYFNQNKPDKAIQSFRSAIKTWNPYVWSLKRDYAAAISEAYFYNKGLISKESVSMAINAMEEVASEHPLDAYNHYALVDMYNQVSDIDPEKFLSSAERQAAIALELSPNRQEIYFSLAKTKSLKGDNASALNILRDALALNDNIPDAHFYYGVISYQSGDSVNGYDHIRRAIDLGRRWKNHLEPQVIANVLADSGHLSDAIELYNVSLKMNDNAETRIKLGIAYFFLGEKDLARSELLEAMKTFDIRESPSYDEILPILRNLNL
jgi:tetratricopeptide (TPR) repeat protein